MTLAVGSRLAHYDVTALIGEGGMGQVYQATDTKLGRQVALKIVPEPFAAILTDWPGFNAKRRFCPTRLQLVFSKTQSPLPRHRGGFHESHFFTASVAIANGSHSNCHPDRRVHVARRSGDAERAAVFDRRLS